MSIPGPSESPAKQQKQPKEERRKRVRLGQNEKAILRESERAPDETTEQLPPRRADGVPDSEAWAWYPLADPTALTCPVIFSHDSLYCFIAAGATVKIYSIATAQLLSTLTLTPSTAPSAASLDAAKRRTKVSCLLLNPANALQLVVGALDGLVRVWDYREGNLLRTLDLGAPIQHMTAHASLPTQIFVALVTSPVDLDATNATAKAKAKAAKRRADAAARDNVDATEVKAGIYSISLKPQALVPGQTPAHASSATFPRSPSRRMRLAQPRVVRALSLSPTGAFLVSLNPGTINICRTASLQKGFATHLDSTDTLTCLAFHPTENYFATGNALGQIRLWYDVLEEADSSVVKGKGFVKGETGVGAVVAAPAPTTAILHWHAHPVASLAFTPNGAYLLSGGEEAVIVLWQLHTGHREFIPRLGAPVVTLSITDAVHAEQQVVARLRDGGVIFVGSQKLKISHTISGIKADPVRLSDLSNRPEVRVPLAVQPLTKALVVSAGHPSSLQFYSPAEDAQLLEIEISPSNRVSSVGKPIEPTRVERVSFSAPATANSQGGKQGSYWMATLDVWENGSFAPERQLKFWRHRPDGTGFMLATRIDRPHDSAVTSMTFSPSPSSPLLLTTSSDSRIKVWAFVGDSWRCRTSLEYRSFAPVDAAWSHDGSMFAVAHARSITLWSLASNSLLHSFPCASIAPATKVEFMGEDGTTLLAGGRHGTVAWDLLTYEETFNMALEINDIATRPNSSTFVATERLSTTPASLTPTPSTSTSAFLISTTTSGIRHRLLPFPIRQSLWVDSLASLAPDDISLAAVDDKGEVILVGEAVARAFGNPVKPTRLPSVGTGQSRLFDELFGAAGALPAAAAGPAPAAAKPYKGEAKASSGMPKSLGAIDAPAHTLPAARLLWRTMLGSFSVEAEKEGKKVEAVEDGMDVDAEGKTGEGKAGGAETLVFAPVESLADIFQARLSLGPGAASTPRKAAK